MNIFEIILSPFTFIIKKLFLFGFSITDNYGLAIILLSFAISALLLPIFIFIEKAKKKDDAIKQKMKPLFDEIKRCYKGQERYYYLKTLNRQYNYSPTRALIPILSLLIQIPFFIAAYQFLENYEPLAGVGFLFIKNLNAPDALFGAINILPIAMTVVNLLTAYFYTRNGDIAERKQMLVVAGVFLVLLFKLPSGLVLYWTMNNVFSFFRLFITNPDVFKKDQKQKFHFNPNNEKLIVPPKYFYPLFFGTIYFYLSGFFYFNGINNNLINISAILLIIVQSICLLYIINNLNKVSTFIRRISLALITILFAFQLLNAISFFLNKELIFNVLNLIFYIRSISLVGFVSAGIIIQFLSLIYYNTIHKIKIDKSIKSNWLIYILSTSFILGLIFFWNPLLIYSSSPETFDFPAINILHKNFTIFIILFLALIITYLFLPKKIKKIWLIFFVVIATVSFIYTTILPIKLGSLQVTRFTEQDNLAAPLYFYFLEFLLLILVFKGVVYIFRKKLFIHATVLLLFLNVFLSGQSIYNCVSTGFFFKTGEEFNQKSDNKLITGEIAFSKDSKNIVYFLIDGFQGWFIKQIMKDNSELQDIYSGFIWYPNTISESNYTHSSLPVIYGGYDYNVNKMNADSLHTIKEKNSFTSELFINKVHSKGYTYTGSHMAYSNIDKNNYDCYIPKWHKQWKKLSNKIDLGVYNEIWYKRLYENAIFYSVPLFIKPKVYNNTQWLSYFRDSTKNKSDKISFKEYNRVRLLPHISTTNTNKPNFIYIHSHFSHNPWNIISKNGIIINDVSPYQNNQWFIEQFAEWIKWMKKQGVYDNTRIILFSDHGADWYSYEGETISESPLKKTPSNLKKIREKSFWRLNPLLMVKDFNSEDKLKENWQLMSNGDVSYIAFDEKNPTMHDTINRTVITNLTEWESHMIQQKTMQVYKQFEISNNIFDLSNWKRTNP